MALIAINNLATNALTIKLEIILFQENTALLPTIRPVFLIQVLFATILKIWFSVKFPIKLKAVLLKMELAVSIFFKDIALLLLIQLHFVPRYYKLGLILQVE
jgi:hypothetical protein